MEEKPATAYLADQTNYKSGYLVKQGGKIKTWKRRLFILDRRNKLLKYYKKPQDTVPKGVIHLEGYQVSDGDDVIKKSFTIMMTKDDFRTYYLVCDDLQTKTQWTEDIRETAKSSPKGPSVTVLIGDPSTTTASSYDVDSDDDDETLRRPFPAQQRKEEPTLAYKRPVVDEPTLFSAQKKTDPPTLTNGYDPNATLMGFNSHTGIRDPNATLICEVHDPNATLIADSHPRAVNDPNATLIPGGTDDNATLVGDGSGTGFINNSVKLRTIGQTPQVIPHLKMIPFNAFFPIVERDILKTLKFGRKKDDNSPNDPDFIGFDTKVVSRRHSEIWAVNGDFYIRDTKSQSGTFLNAMRLSLPGEESKPFKLKSGDTIQFGVDYRGSVDNASRCVSMTIELSFVKPGEKPTMLTAHLPK